MDLETISLKGATDKDKTTVINIDYNLNQEEHIQLKRSEKIAKAILNEECFIILVDGRTVGFAIFDYRFFDLGWIELIVLDEVYRGKGIGGQSIELLCKQSKTKKVFTSTNRSNIPMQKALNKIGFSFAGELNGLDDGDPELFYFKRIDTKEVEN